MYIQPHTQHRHPVSGQCASTAMCCAGKCGGQCTCFSFFQIFSFFLSFFLFFFSNPPTCCIYLEAVAGTKWSRQRVLNIFVYFTTVQRTWARNTCYYSPNRMFCPHKFLSVKPFHKHTHKIGFSQGGMPSTEKKNLNRLDLLGSKLEQRIIGAVTPLALGRLLPGFCLFSVFLNTYKNSLKCVFVKLI